MKFLRSLSLLLAISFFMTAVVPQRAYAFSEGTISTALEKYTYAMNVEWDQQDAAFKADAEKELTASLSEADVNELQSYVAASFKDSKTRMQFMRLVAAIKAQNLSPEAAAAVAQDWAQNHSLGVSYDRDINLHCGLWCRIAEVTIIVIVIKVIIRHYERHNH